MQAFCTWEVNEDIKMQIVLSKEIYLYLNITNIVGIFFLIKDFGSDQIVVYKNTPKDHLGLNNVFFPINFPKHFTVMCSGTLREKCAQQTLNVFYQRALALPNT